MTSKRSSRAHPVRGELLRALRADRGWSQEQAAHRANLSDRLIRKAEAGGPVEPSTIAALAALYSTGDRPVLPAQLLADGAVPGLPLEDSPVRLLERWLDDIWNKGRLGILDELAADDLCFHCEAGVLHTAAELRDRVQRIRRSFRGFRLVVEDTSESGELVVCRWRMTMVHSGTWRGIPPTNRRVTACGSTSIRIRAGKVVEGWEFWDPQLSFRVLAQRSRCRRTQS